MFSTGITLSEVKIEEIDGKPAAAVAVRLDPPPCCGDDGDVVIAKIESLKGTRTLPRGTEVEVEVVSGSYISDDAPEFIDPEDEGAYTEYYRYFRLVKILEPKES